MDNTDILIIGAGVVGLAAASRLSEDTDNIIVVEKHDGFGRETSSRNSEVIHAGFYYPTGTLKARLCVEGNRRLYEILAAHAIPHRQCGKILVANTVDEEAKLHHLLNQGAANGVAGMRMLSASEVAAMEPSVRANCGLWSPTTGIMDTHQLMALFEKQTLSHGATVAYGCEVVGIEKRAGGYLVRIRDTDGGITEILAATVVNAAGLYADTVAAMVGIDVDAEGLHLHPCKGEYFRVSSRHKGRLTHLVYPAPTPISLGVHAVLGLDGSLRLGPNAYYVASGDDYAVTTDHQAAFLREAATYLPFVEDGDLSPDQSGIRPKLQDEHDAFRDFYINEESARGLSGFVNLIGIESPGLTSSPAIAEMVCAMVFG